MGFGIWDLGFGIWDLGFGIWDFAASHTLIPQSEITLRQCVEDQVADFAGGVAHLAGALALHLGAGDVHDGAHHPLGASRLAELLEHHADRVDRSDGVDLARAGVFGGAAAHRLEHAHPAWVGIDVAARRDAHAALHHAGQIGNDVAEHIGRDNHVVILGILHDPHATGVDVVVVGFDVGIVGRYFLEGSPPEVVARGEHVGLGDQREPFALGVVAFAGVFERIANTAFATAAGVDGRLRGDLVRRALVHEAAGAAVEVLGVFAHHDEVDVVGPFSCQRGLDAGEQFDWSEVDVLIQAEPQIEQQLAFEDAGSDVGMADGAQQNCVELAELVEPVFGQGFARFEKSIAAPVEVGQFVGKLLELGNRFENLHAFGCHLGTGPVASNYCNLHLSFRRVRRSNV